MPWSQAKQRAAGDDLRRRRGPQWIQVGVSDLKGEPAEIISTERVEQMRLPADFVKNMRSVITPGTTVLVTQASVERRPRPVRRRPSSTPMTGNRTKASHSRA